MTARKRTRTSAPAKVEETPAVTEEVVAEAPATEEFVEETPTGKEPVEGELHTDEPNSTLKPAQDPTLIHDQIRSKLSGRSEGEERGDMFNPTASQAASKAKMEQIAEQQGFQLTRGREIGARLLARASRKNQ